MQRGILCHLAPELARLGTEERRERVVEEVDDGLRLLGVEAAEPGRDRLVVRQVSHEPIRRSAGTAAAGARCRRGGRRSEGGGERWWRRGFRSGRGGGFGNVALLLLLLLPRPGVGMAAVVGGL